jgi:hypothetical protein
VLIAQYEEETLPHAGAYDWYTKFLEGCNEVLHLQHVHVQPIAVCHANIHYGEKWILGKRRIIKCDIAYKIGTYIGSAETIIYEHLLF